MKTLVDIPPGKIHNGWIWMWPAVGNFCTDYITRATVVRWGLTRGIRWKRRSVASLLDSENKPLMGENNYTLTLEPPPVKEPVTLRG